MLATALARGRAPWSAWFCSPRPGTSSEPPPWTWASFRYRGNLAHVLPGLGEPAVPGLGELTVEEGRVASSST